MTIASGLIARILAQAAAEPDREVCGLLFGDDARIAEARPAANVHLEPARHFEVDPRALFAALRDERAGGARLIGHYHSHPSGSAAPSRHDRDAAGPGLLWLILAGEDAALWRFEAGGFQPVAWVPE